MRRLLALALLSATAVAQDMPVGSCDFGDAIVRLETETLSVTFVNDGNLFTGYSAGSSDSGYRVFGDDLYGFGSLWISGVVNGTRLATGADFFMDQFWPGPLASADAPPTDCSAFDRFWQVSRGDVAAYLGGEPPTADLAGWPAHLGAPVIDGDGVPDNYDLAAGDQPDLLGDVAVWWVMNDAGNVAPYDPTPPVGVEVRMHAFAFDVREPTLERPLALRAVPFVRVEVVNRRDEVIDSLRVTTFADFNVGQDYAGTDTLGHVNYIYDSSPTNHRFGTTAPAVGVQVLSGLMGLDGDPRASPDGRLGLTAASYVYKNGPCGENGPAGRPDATVNVQKGLFRCGRPVHAFGVGFYPTDTTSTTPFYFTGDPASGEFWSEVNTGEAYPPIPGWRVVTATTGPGRLAPGASDAVTFAMPYARGDSHLDSVTKLRGLSQGLRAVYSDGGFPSVAVEGPLPPGPPTELGIRPVRPNPSSGGQSAVLSLPEPTHIDAVVIDALGRRLAVVASGTLPAGETALAIPDGLPPGVYRLRVSAAQGQPVSLPFTVVGR